MTRFWTAEADTHEAEADLRFFGKPLAGFAAPQTTIKVESSSQKRQPQFDLMRVVACLAVILLHTSARTIYLYGQVPTGSWIFADIVDSSTRWCVPVFVMISGALIISKPIRDPVSFMIRRTRTICIPIIVWSIAYLWWRSANYNEHFTILVALQQVFSGFPYYHLYFLFLIGGLYIFAPIVAAALSAIPRWEAMVFALTALMIAALTVTLQGLSSNALTQFVPYLGYFALGALLANNHFAPRVLGALVAGSILLTAMLTYLVVAKAGVNSTWGLYFYSYFNPTVLIMAPAVFCLFSSLIVPAKLVKIIQPLIPLTLGIYLIHPMILETLRWQWSKHWAWILNPYFDIPITFVLTAALSASIVATMRSIPFVRRAF